MNGRVIDSNHFFPFQSFFQLKICIYIFFYVRNVSASLIYFHSYKFLRKIDAEIFFRLDKKLLFYIFIIKYLDNIISLIKILLKEGLSDL